VDENVSVATMNQIQARSRSLDEIKAEILRRVGKVNPFERAQKNDVEEVLGRLGTLAADCWGLEWARLGARYEALGDEQEKRGETNEAGKFYERAYEYYRIGRYPVPSSKEKMQCYRERSGIFSRRLLTRTRPSSVSRFRLKERRLSVTYRFRAHRVARLC